MTSSRRVSECNNATYLRSACGSEAANSVALHLLRLQWGEMVPGSAKMKYAASIYKMTERIPRGIAAANLPLQAKAEVSQGIRRKFRHMNLLME